MCTRLFPCTALHAAVHRRHRSSCLARITAEPGRPTYAPTTIPCVRRSAAELKKRLRSELLLWHPDKLTARVAGRVAPRDADAVAAGARAVAQRLTALMT